MKRLWLKIKRWFGWKKKYNKFVKTNWNNISFTKDQVGTEKWYLNAKPTTNKKVINLIQSIK
jgi:hypothetical protein